MNTQSRITCLAARVKLSVIRNKMQLIDLIIHAKTWHPTVTILNFHSTSLSSLEVTLCQCKLTARSSSSSHDMKRCRERRLIWLYTKWQMWRQMRCWCCRQLWHYSFDLPCWFRQFVAVHWPLIDITATVDWHRDIIPYLIAAHGITDTVATHFANGEAVTSRVLNS